MDTPPTPDPAPQPSKAEMEAWAEQQRRAPATEPPKPDAAPVEETIINEDSAKKTTVVQSTPNAEHVKGWWRVAGVKGLKEHVSAHIRTLKEIPDHWQSVLQEEIAAHPAAAIAVHAHFMVQNHRPLAAQPVPKIKVSGVELTGTPAAAPLPATRGRVVLHLDISPVEGFVGAGS
jgi:hypothetical protein